MSMTTPTPGQPLSEADVSLLQPGDWLRSLNGTIGTYLSSGRGKIAIETRSGVLGGLTITEAYDPASWSFLGRPDQDGWIVLTECRHPCPGVKLDIKYYDGAIVTNIDDAVWSEGPGGISHFRPHAPVSRPGDGVEWPAVTNAWAETYCELTGKNPDGQQVTFVDGATVTTFRDMAKREIEAMLCAAPKAAVRAIAALTPPAEPVSRPAGEGEREAVDSKDKAEGLEADLRSAVLVAWRRGAENWCRWNYPQWVEWLERCRPAAPDAGGGDDPHERWGILNHVGTIWTDETFENEGAGHAYLVERKRQNPTWDLSKHKVVPVLVTITPALQPGGER